MTTNPFGSADTTQKLDEFKTKFAAAAPGISAGFGGVFERLGNKGAPKQTQATSPLTPQTGAPYTKLADPARQQLLQSMLMRARGGQAGGAPNAPLPAPNANIPTA